MMTLDESEWISSQNVFSNKLEVQTSNRKVMLHLGQAKEAVYYPYAGPHHQQIRHRRHGLQPLCTTISHSRSRPKHQIKDGGELTFITDWLLVEHAILKVHVVWKRAIPPGTPLSVRSTKHPSFVWKAEC